MIELHRLTGRVFVLNPDLLERAEATPDTILILISGNSYAVAQTLTEVQDLIVSYRAHLIDIAHTMHHPTAHPTSSPTPSCINPMRPVPEPVARPLTVAPRPPG